MERRGVGKDDIPLRSKTLCFLTSSFLYTVFATCSFLKMIRTMKGYIEGKKGEGGKKTVPTMQKQMASSTNRLVMLRE